LLLARFKRNAHCDPPVDGEYLKETKVPIQNIGPTEANLLRSIALNRLSGNVFVYYNPVGIAVIITTHLLQSIDSTNQLLVV